MHLTPADFDYVRRFTMRHPIASDLDVLPSLKPVDRCKLLAVVLMRTRDRELLQQGVTNGFFGRLKAETAARDAAGSAGTEAGFNATNAALAHLQTLARQG